MDEEKSFQQTGGSMLAVHEGTVDLKKTFAGVFDLLNKRHYSFGVAAICQVSPVCFVSE